MPQPIIHLDEVVKVYDGFTAVDRISLSIAPGQIVAILGSNGAGKSTTIKMICGLLKPTQGTVNIDGVSYDVAAQSIQQRIGYLPEESAMYMDVTIMDYLLFFADLYAIDRSKAKEIITSYAQKLHLDLSDRRLGELSKGMRRKVLIIRSLLNDPDVLIYDEPASGLDPQTAAFILVFVKELKSMGKTILFTSHNLSHVEQIADRVIIIHKGSKIADEQLQTLIAQDTPTFIVRHRQDGTTTETTMDKDAFIAFMRQRGDDLIQVQQQRKTVEDAFLSLVDDSSS